jgi:hypothetical protein
LCYNQDNNKGYAAQGWIIERITLAVYLEATDLKDSYYDAEKWTKDWQKPFNEYERLAGNKLSKSLGKNMPKVNDGSLAASLIETPMNVLPSMQTGKFSSLTNKNAWIGEIANIIWKQKIVPNANTQASFFDKEQIALYRALKYGAQPRYNFFVSNENYTGSDWSLPYIKNVKLEPGKYSVEDSDYLFLDIYFTKLQLRKLIDAQKGGDSAKSIAKANKAETKLAKKQNRNPKLQQVVTEGGWNLNSLQELVDMALTSKEIEEQNINERDKSVYSSGIKTTVCFQRGVGAPFYMFSKNLEPTDLLREWTNPDPTGDLPITMQYCFEDLESPYGKGRVELAGPTQNVLDYMTQAHVLATQLGLQPPKKLSGPIDTANLGSIVNAPDALWMLGGSQIDVVQPTSAVYTQFPANFGLYKSQLQALQGRTDATTFISAESGSPGVSKTAQGVQAQQAQTNSQDNYLRNKADSASAKMATKMMNVHMAQMQGADILTVAEDDATRLLDAGYFDDNPQTEEPKMNEIPIQYDDLKDTFNFEYDPRPESDEDEKNRWLELIDIISSNPNLLPALQAEGWNFDLGEALKHVITSSGIGDLDKVLVKVSSDQGTQSTQAATQVDAAGQPAPTQTPPTPATPASTSLPVKASVNYKDAPDDIKRQMEAADGFTPSQQVAPAAVDANGQPTNAQTQQFSPETVKQAMDHYGVDENTANLMLSSAQAGYSEQQILDWLNGNGGQNGQVA